MAPRPPKPKSTSTSAEPEVLKPKTDKAKIEKVKAPPKPKVPKVKAEVGEPKKSEKADAAAATDKPKKAEKPVAKDGKAEKVKAVTGNEAIALILAYLKEQNRPFSATEVSANLHGKVTKTVADKLMKEMEQSQLIMAKATNGDKKGSQWVFWSLQDPADAASPAELAAMDELITTVRASIPTLKATSKHITAKLTSLKSLPTTSELTTIVDGLQTSNRAKAEKLKGLKEGSVKMVSTEEVQRIEKDWKFWGGKKKVRKAAYRNLEDELAAGLERSVIREKAGIEDADSEWPQVD